MFIADDPPGRKIDSLPGGGFRRRSFNADDHARR
jgi:hypothetical protein